MPNKEPYPKPKSGAKKKIAFGPAPSPEAKAKRKEYGKRKGIDTDLRDKREMPKRLGRDPWGDKTRKDMEMPKVMGSTKAQRAASTLELMNDMRSRNLLRSRNLSRKPNKKGM
jgi:hypothetical protein